MDSLVSLLRMDGDELRARAQAFANGSLPPAAPEADMRSMALTLQDQGKAASTALEAKRVAIQRELERVR